VVRERVGDRPLLPVLTSDAPCPECGVEQHPTPKLAVTLSGLSKLKPGTGGGKNEIN